jgi:hypothetical protein
MYKLSKNKKIIKIINLNWMHKHSEEDHPHEFTHSNDRAHSFVDSFTLDHLQYMQSFEGNR